VRRASFLPFLLLASASAQTRILPLSEVKTGMRGVGRTVFAGSRVEDFQVEILGILENSGPKQSIILARLSGGPLERTGVLQGMSGSPVYIDGRLVGAVALSFPYSKEPVAGIRPIEEMLAVPASPPAAPRAAARAGFEYRPAEFLPRRQEFDLGPVRLAEIATPFWMGGLTRNTFEHFAPLLRAAGLEPVQGLSGGGAPAAQPAAPAARPEPGSMISVQLVTGDMNVGADGTLTHIDGDQVYAFGHRFLSVGVAEFPFARAEVLTLLSSQNTSFKISAPREWLGSITQDRTTALAGRLGRRAAMLPVTLRVSSREPGSRRWNYNLQMVRDRLFTPLLLQMVVFSALDATERTSGLSTIAVRGRFDLEGASQPVRFENLYASELGAPQMVSAALAAPAVSLVQSGLDSLSLRAVEIDMEVSTDKRQYQLDSVWTSRREVRPGDTVEVQALFNGENGAELIRRTAYQVPAGAPPGPLFFTVTDGPASNLADFRQFLTAPPRTVPQLLEFLNGLHPSDRPYLRVWRQQPSLVMPGATLPSLPPSAVLALNRASVQQAGSRVAEIELPGGDFVFTGSKTVQVEVKE
jgi:hypothetical protein